MTTQKYKIYHIVHVDKLESIINDNYLWCDRKITELETTGSTIGMTNIKHRRLYELRLELYPDLFVGDCVPFYFCPCSVMLYLIKQKNHPGLSYKGGQEPIIHLEADLLDTVEWAEKNKKRWVFTLSNAGSRYFEQRNDLSQINDLNWNVINSDFWSQDREAKQAEFLIEHCFPWTLIKNIGVFDKIYYNKVSNIIHLSEYKPNLCIMRNWYY